MRSRSNGGVIGAYALPNQNYANGVFFIHDAAIFNTGVNPIWPLAAGLITSASGGTITIAADNSNYRSHTFTSNGTFTVTTGSAFIDIFLVGGGGCGGAVYSASSTSGAGGGGAGGSILLAQQVWVNSGTTFTVEVGQGGAAPIGSSVGTAGLNSGKPSRVTSGSGYSYTAWGGGFGMGRITSTNYLPDFGGGAINTAVNQTGTSGGSGTGQNTGSPGTITSYGGYWGGDVVGLQVNSKLLAGGGGGAIEPGFPNNYSIFPQLAGNGGGGYFYGRTGYYYGGGGGGAVFGSAWLSDTNASNVGRSGINGNSDTSSGSGGRTYTTGTRVAGNNALNGYGGGGGGSAVWNATNSGGTQVFPGTGGTGTVIFSYRYK